MQEVDESNSEIDFTEAVEALEDGGQAIVDKLKELNLRFAEKPRPVYVSAMRKRKIISHSSLNTRMCLHGVIRKFLD